jgi:hypothetical protein
MKSFNCEEILWRFQLCTVSKESKPTVTTKETLAAR